MNTLITRATITDASLLNKLSTATFYETYSAYNTEDNMRQYVDTHFSEAQLSKELADESNIFFIAFINNEAVGYTKLRNTEEPEALIGRKHIEIERIYVLQAYQKQKIGLALIGHCIETARRQGFEAIWLGVWEQNTKALGFYTRNGFEIFDEHVFYLGSDEQRDHLMKLDL